MHRISFVALVESQESALPSDLLPDVTPPGFDEEKTVPWILKWSSEKQVAGWDPRKPRKYQTQEQTGQSRDGQHRRR